MPTLLDQALEQPRQPPADTHNAIAHDLLEMIRSERKWDDMFADPRSVGLLKRVSAEADEEGGQGEVFDFDPATRGAAKPKE